MKAAALDIGGANIKACGSNGEAWTLPFELWRDPGGLARALASCRRRLEPFDLLAVTLTGELCDCYRTKREGVLEILRSLEAALAERAGAVRVWRTDGRLATLEEARGEPLLAAAANWLALAELAARLAPAEAALLIDVGSTTTDIVPLHRGRVASAARTDTERLAARELVYTGAARTPLAAVVRRLPYHGRSCPVAAELFATTRDAYILLGLLPEDADDARTADGRPATRPFARERLARMLCADAETFGEDDARRAAESVFEEQARLVAAAARDVAARLDPPPAAAITCGSGEFLAAAAAAAIGARAISLGRELGPEVSAAATAYALRELARERLA
jgi:probable H4MPT-linked C1 transfer pathway protein